MKKIFSVLGFLLVGLIIVLTACASQKPGTSGKGTMEPGMMGSLEPAAPGAKPITIDEATEIVKESIAPYRDKFAIFEIIEFTLNFYVDIAEKSTGIHAMELLINKYTGEVSSEPGPNIMWNTKYGTGCSVIGGCPKARSALTSNTDMSVSAEQAQALAQQFLDVHFPGAKTEDVKAFYGYYTLHTVKNGQIEGMLSINGYSGEVWYHTWHGAFIQMKEFEEG